VDRLPGWDAERLGMYPAVVLGQDLAEVAGTVGDAYAGRRSKGDVSGETVEVEAEFVGRRTSRSGTALNFRDLCMLVSGSLAVGEDLATG